MGNGWTCTAAALFATWLPALPMISYRMARLPIPSVPTGPEDLKTDAETVDGKRVLEQSERADAFLAAIIAALAVIGAGAGLVLAASSVSGLLLSVVLGLLMLMRARWFLSRRQRLPLLVAGTVTLGGAVCAGYLASDHLLRLVVVPGMLIIVAAVGVGVGLAAERRRSPVPARLLDIFETLLIVAIVPLAVWAGGLLGWVRSLNG